jgi:hypothetical protein
LQSHFWEVQLQVQHITSYFSTSIKKRLHFVVDSKIIKCPLNDILFINQCKTTLCTDGALVLPGFLTKNAIQSIKEEGLKQKHLAYFTDKKHNIYLSEFDPGFDKNHPRNRLVSSSKGCITTDQIPYDSALKTMYGAEEFRSFLSKVLGENHLYEFADNLSSINLHYADENQELGWHFDNSSFAITLMIQKPKVGGEFEYVKDVRNADAGEMNFVYSGKVLDGEVKVEKLAINAGDLILFRGRNSMHRVTPVIGDTTRILVVLAYNSKPGISLSESARMTFFGRLG